MLAQSFQTVSRTCGDAVVLAFCKRQTQNDLFGVGERTDNTQRVVVCLVAVLRLKPPALFASPCMSLCAQPPVTVEVRRKQWYLRIQPEQRPR